MDENDEKVEDEIDEEENNVKKHQFSLLPKKI